MSRQTVAIVHPEWGIYLGSCMGLGFFSALDCAGQDTAAIFPSEAEARSYVATWEENSNPDKLTYPAVKIAGDHWATIEELDAAGLSQWTVPLKSARMGEAVGRA
jgi:predicted methyltransferase